MSKKQISVRLDEDIVKMRDELIAHFTNEVAKASSEQVIALAIKELHKSYVGEFKKGKSHYSATSIKK